MQSYSLLNEYIVRDRKKNIKLHIKKLIIPNECIIFTKRDYLQNVTRCEVPILMQSQAQVQIWKNTNRRRCCSDIPNL